MKVGDGSTSLGSSDYNITGPVIVGPPDAPTTRARRILATHVQPCPSKFLLQSAAVSGFERFMMCESMRQLHYAASQGNTVLHAAAMSGRIHMANEPQTADDTCRQFLLAVL
eukprot:s1949_g8.t1